MKCLIVFMTNVHVKLRWRTTDARDNATPGVEIIDNTVEYILIVRVNVVLAIKVSWLAVCEVIVGMSASEPE